MCACSTPLPIAPSKIDPPPLILASPCPLPPDLASEATARELATWAVQWIDVAGCEWAKRRALLAAWPK
jgi:hypothetical protein